MSSKKPTIGMGVLSWRGADSLDYALSTYAKAGLFELFDQHIIILPEPDDAVRSVAQKHPLKTREFKQNLGIAGGMRAVAEALTTDYVLFLENDCPLIEPITTAQAQIKLSVDALASGHAFMARLRSRREPGELFSTLGKYKRYWDNGFDAKLRRLARPAKAKRLCGSAVYAIEHPDQRHPNFISAYKPSMKMSTYIVSPKVMPWTNQSILMKRQDFLDVILPYVEAQPLKRGINGFHNVEIELNRSKFWTQSNFKILCPKGIFTHKRFNDRGYV